MDYFTVYQSYAVDIMQVLSLKKLLYIVSVYAKVHMCVRLNAVVNFFGYVVKSRFEHCNSYSPMLRATVTARIA